MSYGLTSSGSPMSASFKIVPLGSLTSCDERSEWQEGRHYDVRYGGRASSSDFEYEAYC